MTLLLLILCWGFPSAGNDLARHAFFKNVNIETDFERVKAFVEREGYDPNVKINVDSKTALHHAIHNKHERYKLVQFLLKNGANPNIPDQFGRTVLHVAIDLKVRDYIELHDYNQMIKLLLENGADVNRQDDRGKTAFHLIVEKDRLNTAVDIADLLSPIKLLLSYEADINMQDGQGKTPLHYASSKDVSEWSQLLIKFLLKNGADPQILDNEGKKADEVATASCREAFLKTYKHKNFLPFSSE